VRIGGTRNVHSFRSVFDDKFLMTAFTVSVGVHATALAVHFVDPERFQVHVADVRSKSSWSTPRAIPGRRIRKRWRRFNLDGGGGNDLGRRTSPLPSSFEMRDGETLETARRVVQQLREEQRHLLTQLAFR